MNTTVYAETASPAERSAFETKTYNKVVWRILPLLFVCYILSYLDRVNVGFAKLQMMSDLNFSDTIYGVGAGIFFIGYFLFEVPSNLILHRVGARRWIARIMITWGLISASMMFVTSPTMFYVLRFLLGVAEAGFFPGIILYLTYWFPAERRGQIIALFMAGVPIAGVIGGPVSGMILEKMSGVYGFAGWQWLFVLEGLPSAMMGLVVLAYLNDRIQDAKWLTPDEKKFLTEVNSKESAKGHAHLGAVLKTGRFWVLCVIYFSVIMGLYGVGFWLPTIIKAMGVESTTSVGFIYAIPYLTAAVGMILIGKSADRLRERRWHLAIPCFLGGIGLALSVVFAGSPVLAVAALSLATLGIVTAMPLFWSFPTMLLSGVAAAGGIAFINSFANIAGFVSPYMMGMIKDATASTGAGMYVLALFMLLAGTLTLLGFPAGFGKRT